MWQLAIIVWVLNGQATLEQFTVEGVEECQVKVLERAMDLDDQGKDVVKMICYELPEEQKA